MSISLLVFLVLAAQSAIIDEQLATPVEGGDLAFLRALNNYFGCKIWGDTSCLECSANYFFNDNKICSVVVPQCKKFNRGVGICEECYLGYAIYSGQCIPQDISKSLDKGCKKFDQAACVQCSARWFFGESGHCEPVDDLCRKWDQQSGKCTACYQGYELKDGACKQGRQITVSTIDAYCSQWNGRACIACAERAYTGPLGICIPVSDFCRTWDKFDGFCLSCYKGYDLAGGKCTVSATISEGPSDIGCKLWDWDEQVCLQCSLRWVLKSDGYCSPVSDDCKFYNGDGRCSQCYTGYSLANGTCEISKSNMEGPPDIGCRIWNWEELKCLQCSQRWTFNNASQCIPVSDYCKNYNPVSGYCTECYRGYSLAQGRCMLSASDTMKPSDPGCKIWDWDLQVCLQCSYRWVFVENNGTCKKVSDLCNTYDGKGDCLTCYAGYQLKVGNCEEAAEDYCELRSLDGTCSQCYLGYDLKNNSCVVGNPLCKSTDPNGYCTSCFKTYALYRNICVPLVSLVNLAQQYAKCCPQKLAELKREAKIV